ncbi:MAG: hypothetical protein IKX85_06350, partial [Clostridia bacterium]|nr:hypothetical protein [Clostridia bacterium]
MADYPERRPVEIDENCPVYTAEKKIENGSPVLYLNGKKTAPLIYALSDIPISNPLTAQAQRNIANFARQGIDMVSTDVNLAKGWHKNGPYRPDFLIGDLTAVIETNPRAAILLRLHVNAPYWWMRDNPDELCIYGKGDVPYRDDGDYERLIDGDLGNNMRVSIASEKWKRDAGEALSALLAGIRDTPQGRHVIGIQVACGVYGEWHQWGFDWHPDYSRPMTDYFRSYLREKYRTDAELRKAWRDPAASIETALPAPAEMRDPEGGGPYRVPAESAYVVDSLKALQRSVPDAILHFASLIRREWDRPILTGAFYGYYDAWRQVYVGGHLEPKRLFDGGEIDYCSGPFHYQPEIRGIGGTSCSRGLLESVRLNGVLWLTEMDNPPIGSPECVGGVPERRAESVALMKRHVLEPFTRGMGTWFFDHRLVLDLGYGTTIYVKKGWWDHPALLREIRTLKNIADHTALSPYRQQAEVLCVFDTESRYYSNAADVFTNGNMPLIFNTLGRSGAIYDSVNFDDLALADPERYKAVLFIHVPYLTKARREMIGRFKSGGRHLLWINTSGYLSETGAGAKNISEVCGIRVKECGAPSAMDIRYRGILRRIAPPDPYSLRFTPEGGAEVVGTFASSDIPAAAKKEEEGYTSWYFSLFPSDTDILREIFRSAGVHIYSENG